MLPSDHLGAKLRRRPLAAIIAMVASLSGAAAEPPARVEFSIGRVNAVSAAGESRPLRKGESIEIGESVVTESGRVHLRFSDGGYISLKPNSEFRVDEYQFKDGEPQESRGFFNLLRGGLRALTGLIGKVNRKNYQMTTPVATIGIRGTIFEADLGNSITVRVLEGSIELFDRATGEFVRQVDAGEVVTYDETTGQVTIGGQVVVVPDVDTATSLNLPPAAAGGEDVNAAGKPDVLGYE